MEFSVDFDPTAVMDGLGRIDKGKSKAMKATRSDFRVRNSSAVERGVTAHYNVKRGRVRKDKKEWRNTGEYSGEQVYKSSPLGLGNFSLHPRKMPKRRTKDRAMVPGLGKPVRMPLPYTITFNIKGESGLGPEGGYFVREGNVWHRLGNKPNPIERVSTLSVAAMIRKDARKSIQAELEKLMEERFAHNVERFTSSG